MSLKTISKLREINDDFPNSDKVALWNTEKKKMIGWMCSNYVPEEIIYAAGMIPVRISTDAPELKVDLAESYIHYNTCSYAKTCLQLVLDKKFNFLDGFVTTRACDGQRMFAENWRQFVPSPVIHMITLPRKRIARSYMLYTKELETFKVNIENTFNIKITEEALIDAINTYNHTRKLLREINAFRNLPNPKLSGSEALEIVNASGRMPRDAYNRLLEELLQELKQSNRELSGSKVMLVGVILNNSKFIADIEDVGFVVVTDELCTSTEYWDYNVNIKKGEKALQALSRSYLDKFPHPVMHDIGDRYDKIISLAKNHRVEGIIMEVMRYCVPYILDRPVLKRHLEDVGYPVLDLEIEYGSAGSGQIRTRIQAFKEMLDAKKSAVK